MTSPAGATRGARLDGRVALVTGAGRGIGRSAAVALADAGAEVWLVARTASEIEQAAAEIRAAGGRAKTCACDVTDAAALKRTFAALPALDVMVNNAGANIPEPFVDVSEEHLDRLLGLNVRAAFLAAQAAARKMLEAPDRKQRGGAIINVSSQMGHVGAPNRSVYCLSKHALEGLTKAMAVELAPHNIRVNAVAPGFVDTPMAIYNGANELESPRFLKQYVEERRIPQARAGKSEEIAGVILFLASDDSSYVTGHVLVADGGLTCTF